MAIFLDDVDYLVFTGILRETITKLHIDLWVVCAMPNHYHLVWRTHEANLSRAVRHLNGTFAQWWNKRHAHVGHVFQGRFKCQIVETSLSLLRLCRYVILNPVRAELCGRPADWRWSSARALLDPAAPSLVDIVSLCGALDTDDVEAVRERLLEFVVSGDAEIATSVRTDRRFIGTPEFAKLFGGQAKSASREVPRRERYVQSVTLASLLSNAVACDEGLRAAVQRAHAIYGYSAAEIARCVQLSPVLIARMLGKRSGGQRRTQRDTRPDPEGQNLDLTPSARS